MHTIYTPYAAESVAVFCHFGSDNVVSVYPFKQPEQLLHYKYSVEGGFTRFIYSKKHQVSFSYTSNNALIENLCKEANVC